MPRKYLCHSTIFPGVTSNPPATVPRGLLELLFGLHIWIAVFFCLAMKVQIFSFPWVFPLLSVELGFHSHSHIVWLFITSWFSVSQDRARNEYAHSSASCVACAVMCKQKTWFSRKISCMRGPGEEANDRKEMRRGSRASTAVSTVTFGTLGLGLPHLPLHFWVTLNGNYLLFCLKCSEWISAVHSFRKSLWLLNLDSRSAFSRLQIR